MGDESSLLCEGFNPKLCGGSANIKLVFILLSASS
jgi:hypothetical protein